MPEDSGVSGRAAGSAATEFDAIARLEKVVRNTGGGMVADDVFGWRSDRSNRMAQTASFWAARAVISICGIAALAAMYYMTIAARPPLTWHGSSVYPTVVAAGGEINVTRNFTVHRDTIIDVQRKLIAGDCNSKKGCLQYDLDPSTFLITVGEYNRTLPHQIPDYVVPNTYTLQFEIHWQNFFGFKYALRHPELRVEVVRRP